MNIADRVNIHNAKSQAKPGVLQWCNGTELT